MTKGEENKEILFFFSVVDETDEMRSLARVEYVNYPLFIRHSSNKRSLFKSKIKTDERSLQCSIRQCYSNANTTKKERNVLFAFSE